MGNENYLITHGNESEIDNYWIMKFKKIALEPNQIVHHFQENLELYIFIEELFYRTTNIKLIVILHKIMLILTEHNIDYFFQLEKFDNGSIPNHILSKFVFLLLFSN